MKLDLHTHTIYSDGVDTPETVVARAKAVGLDGVAITDHNSIGGWKRAMAAGKSLGIDVVPANEIGIRDKGKTVGEIIALFMQEDIKRKFGPNDVDDLLDRIKDQDALSVIPHPFGDYARVQRATSIIDKKGLKVDAVEVMNGRCPADSNAAAFSFAIKKKFGQTAGSDAHRAEEIGHCYTFVEANGIEEFRKGIKRKLSRAIGMQKSPKGILYHRAMCKLEWMFRKK